MLSKMADDLSRSRTDGLRRKRNTVLNQNWQLVLWVVRGRSGIVKGP